MLNLQNPFRLKLLKLTLFMEEEDKSLLELSQANLEALQKRGKTLDSLNKDTEELANSSNRFLETSRAVRDKLAADAEHF